MARVIKAKSKRPAIIHFQPTGYRKVSGESAIKKLAQRVKKFAGITIDAKGATMGAIVYYETICGTGQFDDCSEEDPGEQLEF